MNPPRDRTRAATAGTQRPRHTDTTQEDQVNRDPPWAARLLERAELTIYLATAFILVATAGGLLVIAIYEMVTRLLAGAYVAALLQVLDRALLLILMLTEIIYTVRRVAQKRKLEVAPSSIVAIIAAIRRMLIITAEGTTHIDIADPVFQAALAELALLALLVLALAFALRLIPRERVAEPS